MATKSELEDLAGRLAALLKSYAQDAAGTPGYLTPTVRELLAEAEAAVPWLKKVWS